MVETKLSTLLDDCRARLDAAGMNLWGVVRVRDIDGCQSRERRVGPSRRDARSVVVVGSGGRRFWESAVAEELHAWEPAPGFHPLDRRTEQILGEEQRRLAQGGYESELLFPFARKPVDFVTLAELAGLGVRSPVVPLLLHPEYGPWVSLRGAFVLAEDLPATGPLRDFSPCDTCPAPCLSACPVDAVLFAGKKDDAGCAEHRSRGGCSHGCDVRGVCVQGPEHRYGVEERAFRNAYARFAMERYYGRGRWRFVPKWLRRRMR